MAQRRALRFASFDEVIRDVEQLRRAGYEKAGTWELAQVAGHLTAWLTFPLDGFPRPILPIRILMAVLRATIGPRELRKILESGTMKAGGPTMPETVPAAGGDEATAVDRLTRALTRFQAHQGPVHASPFFGPMTSEEARRLQLAHCAHHLSFLVPISGS